MFFNSFEYAVFLPLVFILYWFVAKRSLRLQNVILMIASYVFYAFWDWRFLFLLAFSTFLDYYTGLAIFKSQTRKGKKTWLLISILVNLGFLGFFKYYNFFIESFADLLQSFGFTPHIATLSIILPVGISFYTFHGLSYIFDIYNGKIRPATNFINYSLFVSFFPLLVAGPIERATHLLPQIENPRKFDYEGAIDGLRQILWGLFKKMVIADLCAVYVNTIFENPGDYSGSTLVIGAVLFAFQIYGDFSGYSDIALGTARLLGFTLLRNFAYPYFSRDIAEFWRRWHISLSSWFRDYLYIPLGGSRGGLWKSIRNTFIIFLVSGFWHGANWTFIAWGALHAIYFLPLLLLSKNRSNLEIVARGRWLPTIREAIGMIVTFMMVSLAWIFFRSENMTAAIDYLSGIFSGSLFNKPEILPVPVFLLIGVLLFIEWFGREQQHGIARFAIKWPVPVRWAIYITMTIFILISSDKQQKFIYFQF
jgi:alginate O-acetyltransferase complex protein AlgI